MGKRSSGLARQQFETAPVCGNDRRTVSVSGETDQRIVLEIPSFVSVPGFLVTDFMWFRRA